MLKIQLVLIEFTAFLLFTNFGFGQTPKLITQTGHTAPIYSLSHSPDGRYLATNSGDNTIKLWEIKTGRELMVFPSEAQSSVMFSKNGKYIFAISHLPESNVKIWETETGQLYKTLFIETEAFIDPVIIESDSIGFAGYTGNQINIVDMNGKQDIKNIQFTAFDEESSFSRYRKLSPDGRVLITVNNDDTINFWEIGKKSKAGVFDLPDRRYKKNILRGTGVFPNRQVQNVPYEIAGVVFSPDGRFLAIADIYNKVHLWDIEKKRIVGNHKFDNLTINFLALSSNGRLLAASGRFPHSSVTVFDFKNKTQIKMEGHGVAASALQFSPDSQTLASGGWDNLAKIWDVKSGREKQKLGGHVSWIEARAFSPNGQIFAHGAGKKYINKDSRYAIKLWEINSGKLIRTLTHSSLDTNILSLIFSPDGKLLASGRYDSFIDIWEVETGKLLRSLPGHKDGVNTLNFLSDGNTLISGSKDSTLKIWEVQTGSLLKTLTPGSGIIFTVAISRDEKYLASAGEEGTVKVWEIKSGALLHNFSKHPAQVLSLKFSNDGTRLISGGANSVVKLWDVNNGQLIKEFYGSNTEEQIISVDFSDGKQIIAGGSWENIMLWDAESGKKLKTYHLNDKTDFLEAVSIFPDLFNTQRARMISPNRKFELRAMADGGVDFYNIQTGEPKFKLLGVDENDWLATTPDGFFDGTLAARSQNLWRFTRNLFDVAPVEAFYYEYFYPDLVKKIMAGEILQLPQNVRPFSEKDIRQAAVKLFEGVCLSTQRQLKSDRKFQPPTFETDLCIEITASPTFSIHDFPDTDSLVSHLVTAQDVISKSIFSKFSSANRSRLTDFVNKKSANSEQKMAEVRQIVRLELNSIVRDVNFYKNKNLQQFTVNQEIKELVLRFKAEKNSEAADILSAILNRKILERIYGDLIRPLDVDGSLNPPKNIELKNKTDNLENKECIANEPCLQDMRLFWNGRLMRKWTGNMARHCNRVNSYRLRCETTVPLVKGENKYSAYLFNQDRVKSIDAEISITRNQ